MHIHGVQNFVGQAAQAGRGAELAARAASNRKKLLEVSGEGDGSAVPEGAWMIAGWARGSRPQGWVGPEGQSGGTDRERRGPVRSGGDVEDGGLGGSPTSAGRQSRGGGKVSYWA